MFLLDIWLLSSLTLLGEQVSSQSINDVVRSSVILRSRDDCGKNSSWQVTKENWKNLEAGKNIALWWEEDVSADPHQSFAIELGRDFGSHLNAFECGIGALSTCIAPGCSEYDENNDPPWAYLALISVVKLNEFFNAIYTGISNGQIDYQATTKDIANIFFPWKEPKFLLGDAAFWVVALVTAIFAAPLLVAEAGAEAIAVGAVGLGAFVGAGVQQVSSALEPSAISSQMTKSEGLAKLDLFAVDVGSAARKSVEIWANATMRGEVDSTGMSILDYLQEGSFLGGGLPTNSEIEQFYKKQMVSRTINSQWRKQKIFVTFFKTDDPEDASGPNTTKHYSAEDGGVYYLYKYTEDGILRGHLDKPWGLDYLNGTRYGINGNDITKASAGAFRAGGFNYTEQMAKDRITASMSSIGKLTPFQDGAGWEGTWTIPVCDMGTNNWNTQFANKSSRYGPLPCCCGPNCQDTKNFTKAANLRGFQTLLRGCKAQLKDSSIKYNDVDYGFGWKKSLPLTWATFSKGQRAGVALGIIFPCLAILYLLMICVATIADSDNRTPPSRSAYSYQLEELQVTYSRYQWD